MEAAGDANGQYEYAPAPAPDPNTLPSLQHQTEPAQHPAAASEPAKPKRAHVQAACVFCKGRKMRCDGAKPACANCVNRKLACEYPEPPARARAPRASNGSPTPSKRKPPQQPQQPPSPDKAMLPIQYYAQHPPNGAPPPPPMYYYPMPGMAPDGAPLPPHMAHPYYMHHQPPPPPPQPARQRAKRAASEMEGDDDGAGADGDYAAHASAANGGGGGGGGGKKRTGKRATMACHSCRSRKLKCDESMPACSQCQRRNLPCAYDDQVRRRGPSKRKRSNDPDGPSPEPQPAPHAHAHTHPLGVIPIPGPDGTKFMQMVDQNGVPVHYMVSIDPNTQQMVPMHAPPGMHLGAGEDGENGGEGSPHTTNGLSPHSQDGDDLADQHPAQPPVIWS